MGICSSYESTSVATAKLILQDGQLKEFPCPVKVSYVLQRVAEPASFICNSDMMDFDDVISPISSEDELLPGQLYFALPVSRLRHRLQADEMAALAVKASSALMKSSGDKCGYRRMQPAAQGLDASVEDLRTLKKKVAVQGESGRKSESGGSRRGRKEKFSMILSAIPEWGEKGEIFDDFESDTGVGVGIV